MRMRDPCLRAERRSARLGSGSTNWQASSGFADGISSSGTRPPGTRTTMSSSTHGGFFSSLGKADLGIVISTSLPRVRMEGDELTYLVAVTNHGPATATGIQVHDVW